MIKIEKIDMILKYSESESESEFSIHVYDNGDMFPYHNCKSESQMAHDILIPYEVKRKQCMDCGKLDIPDTMQAVWKLLMFDEIQRGIG